MDEAKYQSLTGITPGDSKMKNNKGRALIICLDKSGSMSGVPFQALKKGALMMSESLFSGKDYEKISVCFYDDRVNASEPNTLQEYK